MQTQVQKRSHSIGAGISLKILGAERGCRPGCRRNNEGVIGWLAVVLVHVAAVSCCCCKRCKGTCKPLIQQQALQRHMQTPHPTASAAKAHANPSSNSKRCKGTCKPLTLTERSCSPRGRCCGLFCRRDDASVLEEPLRSNIKAAVTAAYESSRYISALVFGVRLVRCGRRD